MLVKNAKVIRTSPILIETSHRNTAHFRSRQDAKPPHLLAERVHHVHPVVLRGVIAEDGLGEASGHVDKIVQGHGGDTALGDGDVGPQQPDVGLGIVALDLGMTGRRENVFLFHLAII